MKMNSPERELTFGEKAVGLTFNPGNNPAVDQIKRTCANAIDEFHNIRENSDNPEIKAQLTLGIRRIQEGLMWGVKGITWQY